MGHRLNFSWHPVIAIAVLALLLTGCGGSQPAAVNADQPPSIETLQELLQAELARLGTDPAKTAAHAPSGTDNAVFCLQVHLNGGSVPTPGDVRFTWVEQLVGDYNQDGLVGVADLTPIAQHWEQLVGYDAPAVHDGIEHWPSGDPLGDGAQNWRLARIDGNHDGLIGLGDITPIAQHWQERLSGYQLCRRVDGGDSVEVTQLPRPEVVPGSPVVYSYDFALGQQEAWAASEYFVQSWSEPDEASGEPSAPVAVGAGEACWAARFELAEVDLHMLLYCDAVVDSSGHLCVVAEAGMPS